MPLERIERLSKIFSIAAIPVLLAVFGWIVQDRLATRHVNREYVQLAVSILSNPETSEIDRPLRGWAVDLLNAHSPVRFGVDLSEKLKDGKIGLQPSVFPFHCVPEPVPNRLNPELMDVELFFINHTPGFLTTETLTKFLEDKASKRAVPAESSDVVLRARSSVEIQNVITDPSFNQDKGQVRILAPSKGAGEWRVMILEMSPFAILKVRILTTRPLLGAKRGEMYRVPLVIDYPGLKAW